MDWRSLCLKGSDGLIKTLDSVILLIPGEFSSNDSENKLLDRRFSNGSSLLVLSVIRPSVFLVFVSLVS